MKLVTCNSLTVVSMGSLNFSFKDVCQCNSVYILKHLLKKIYIF